MLEDGLLLTVYCCWDLEALLSENYGSRIRNNDEVVASISRWRHLTSPVTQDIGDQLRHAEDAFLSSDVGQRGHRCEPYDSLLEKRSLKCLLLVRAA